ncbi:MAG TPA: citrate/2-methylcitrate synthase, partial [Solirubrobacter sp.]|nr:citrate/2-methylcitrate synthase [Solirubrobacter sp.]
MLTTDEAARRLGVKPETLYAYVSRGQLTRHGGRRSLFAREEIERLAARSRRGGRAGALELVVDTELTLVDPAGALYFRGTDATALARESTYEAVAELLWGTEPTGAGDEAAGRDARPARRGERAPWVAAGAFSAPPGARPADALRAIVALAAAADPLRADLRPRAVRHTARGLIAAMVDGLPRRGEPVGASIAARLWARLHDAPPTPARLRALDGALILLADHELALSALAARVAASAHADPYLVVLAGLAAQGGALHGAAGTSVERLLRSIPDAAAVPGVLGERMAAGETLPGFGHAVYTGADPRAAALLALLDAAEPDPERHAVLDAVLQAAGRLDGPKPNVDLALGALTDCLGL